jgi:hypothetical protein
MWCIFSYVFLFYYVELISSSMTIVPVIHNVSLQMLDYNSTIINGTCNECLCEMLLSTESISAFNCFQNNNTCEIFSQSLKTSSFLLMNNSASSIYFTSLPIDDETLTTTIAAQSTSNFISKLFSDFFKYYNNLLNFYEVELRMNTAI